MNSYILVNRLSLIFLMLISFRSMAQEIITGPQFRTATLNSIDILSSHLVLQQAQAQYNKVLNTFSTTYSVAPVKYLFNDGTVEKGRLRRQLYTANFGYGEVKKIGVYGGLQLDGIEEHLNNKSIKGLGTSNTLIQGLGYIGVVFLDFQIDIGTTLAQGFQLDGNYDFTKDEQQIPFDNSPLFTNGGNTILSLYHKTGVFASAIFSEDEYNPMYGRSSKKHLNELRTNFQPLKRYLPKIYGLPFLGFVRYASSPANNLEIKDYYNAILETEKEKKASGKPYYEYNNGSDNLFEKGIRASYSIQLYPKVSFKKAELAYTNFKNKDKFIYGIRAQLFNINGKAIFGFDSFIMLSGFEKNFNLNLSYSYNSPQNITFLPIPRLHVIGVQVILGKRETAKAIIPYAAAVLADEEVDK